MVDGFSMSKYGRSIMLHLRTTPQLSLSPHETIYMGTVPSVVMLYRDSYRRIYECCCVCDHIPLLRFLWEMADQKDIETCAKYFKVACEHGNLSMVQWFLKQMNQFTWSPTYDYNRHFKTIFNNAFWCACLNNQLSVVLWLNTQFPCKKFIDYYLLVCMCAKDDKLEIFRWLVKHYGDPSVAKKYESEIFRIACENGCYRIVRWMMSLDESFRPDPHIHHNRAFKLACRNGHFKLARYLWDQFIKPTGQIVNLNDIIDDACCYGYLHILQFIYVIQPSHPLDLRAHHDLPFRSACQMGHLPVAQWLLKMDPTIDHRCWNDQPFINACKNNHLHVTSWLWNLDPRRRPNHHAMEDLAFRWSCKERHMEMARWLMTLHPPMDPELIRTYYLPLVSPHNMLE